MSKIVAFLGEPGSFSDSAKTRIFRDEAAPLRTSTFREIFEAVLTGQAQYGIVPVENLLSGSVHEVYDLLAHYPLCAIAEHYEVVSLSLLGNADSLNQVSLALSHPKAIEQCHNFFIKHPKIIPNLFSDTGAAAKYVSELRDPKLAAIASPEAASLYGLKELVPNIQDEVRNFTRFLLITKEQEKVLDADKCSFQFLLNHTPGSLLKVLQVIADFGLNLTKIESRPIRATSFEYRFFADLMGDLSKIKDFEEKLKAVTLETKIYGIYKAAAY